MSSHIFMHKILHKLKDKNKIQNRRNKIYNYNYNLDRHSNIYNKIKINVASGPPSLHTMYRVLILTFCGKAVYMYVYTYVPIKNVMQMTKQYGESWTLQCI